MILSSLLIILLAALASPVSAQVSDTQGPIVFDSIHNATTIYGTWSSGSKGVVTGPSFANPANMTFSYPQTTGVSYSFTTDGHYESARYRFNSNGSEPTCITGVIIWVHGTYLLNANGSITLQAFPDGYQQVQDPCAAQSNFIQSYTYTEYYMGWRIYQDPVAGYKLHMFMADGTPVAPQFQVSVTPNMLPTKVLRNITTVLSRRSTSGAEESSLKLVTAALGAAGLVVLAAATLL